MNPLYAQLNGKTLLAFSATPDDALTKLVQRFGACLAWAATMLNAAAIVAQKVPDGAILDVEADPDSLFDIAEMLGMRDIPFVFAVHAASNNLPRDFIGYTFPSNSTELGAIVNHLFGIPTVH
jgi:hypothetical protein